MTKEEKLKIITGLIDHLEKSIRKAIEEGLDRDFHPVDLFMGAANSTYIYATLVAKGLSDKEIVEEMKKIEDDIKAHIKEKIPTETIKKKNETIH